MRPRNGELGCVVPAGDVVLYVGAFLSAYAVGFGFGLTIYAVRRFFDQL